jgi:Na+-driven multidrug efflux pump
MAEMAMAAMGSMVCIGLAAVVFAAAERASKYTTHTDEVRNLSLLFTTLMIISVMSFGFAIVRSPCYRGIEPATSD